MSILVIFARRRAAWQWFLAGIALLPIVAAALLLRLTTWSAITTTAR